MVDYDYDIDYDSIFPHIISNIFNIKKVSRIIYTIKNHIIYIYYTIMIHYHKIWVSIV